MACYSPISGWHSKHVNKDTGKRSIVFQPREAYTDMPVELPCGKCTGCRADQSLMWSIRAYHEAQEHEHNCFITLTYSDTHIPADGLIDKRHLQLFFKRLRKAVNPTRLRYIACGEYGDVTYRPHYHALLFGLDFLDYRRIQIGETLYTHPTLEKAWGKGQVVIGNLNMSSICYTCGYVQKKITDTDTFSLMSRRPAIGKNWLDKNLEDLVRTGVTVIEGREYPIPPRYFTWYEKELQHVKIARRNHAKKQANKYDPVERRRRSDSKQINHKSSQNRKEEKL